MPTAGSPADGETSPPIHPEAPAEAYTPEQARRHREYSVWDPRAAPGTYLLLAINVAVYLWMVTHHVSWNRPTDMDLLHYGANEPWNVLHGEWYRLLTATFVHVGLIHIAVNMWCLWNLGILGEPLLGPFGMVAVYMLTGIAGNLLSMAWNVGMAVALYHNSDPLLQIGAGASGAVFGIAGILIVLLSNRALPFPWAELRHLRGMVIKFAAINLVIGLSTWFINVGVRIDNFAHIGGFLSGLALGVPLVPRMTSGRTRYLRRQKVAFTVACFALALFGYFIARMAP